MRLLIFTLCSVFFSLTSIAQKGRLSGKIVDGASGNTLAGATIVIEPGNKTTFSDVNGQYAFNNLTAGTYRVLVTNISYTAAEETVKVDIKDGAVLNIVLQPTSVKLNDVSVKTTRINRESASALLIQQKNRTSVSDGISFEVIRKTPDRSASDVLKRVTGASLQDDKFAIIRGLNDRYNYGMLNGAPLPSSESDRKAFAFDIFPANLLDNTIIAKTATPDMPGEFGGGIIIVNTKSTSEKNFQSFSLGTAYNTITTGKDRVNYQGSRWNFLDDGTDLKGPLPTTDKLLSFTPSEQESLAKRMVNNWGLTHGTFAPNFNAQYSLGHNFQDDEGKDFISVLVSGTLSRTYSLFEINRNNWEPSQLGIDSPSMKVEDYKSIIYSSRLLAGVLANVSMKINKNNTFSLKNIYNVNTDDRLIQKTGQRDITSGSPVDLNQNSRVFVGNRFISSQLEGQHYLPNAKVKINWSGFYSKVTRTNPARNDTYLFNESAKSYIGAYSNFALDNDIGSMRKLGVIERIAGGQADITKTINSTNASWRTELKAGGLYQQRTRKFETRRLGFAPSSTFNYYNIPLLSIDSIFAPDNLGKGGWKFIEETKPYDTYDGMTRTTAYYAMVDQKLFKYLRVIAGARVEDFKMELKSRNLDYSSLTYKIDEKSVLPSVNMVVALSNRQNLRLCYSKTVNRPEFREISPSLFWDYSLNYTVSGDTMLRTAKIDNYDIRYEFYPGRAQVLSVTGFYKKFHDPIEQRFVPLPNRQISYQNSPDASNIGAEAELRVLMGALFNKEKGFLNNLTILTNYAYIKSKVKVPITIDSTEERALQGQSNFVFNAGFMYNDEKHGFGISSFVNRAGPRIFVGASSYFPAIWENGRTVWDLQVSKTFIKQKLEVRAGVKDILAQTQYFFEDFNNNKKFDNKKDNITQSTTFGRTISLTASYKL